MLRRRAARAAVGLGRETAGGVDARALGARRVDERARSDAARGVLHVGVV